MMLIDIFDKNPHPLFVSETTRQGNDKLIVLYFVCPFECHGNEFSVKILLFETESSGLSFLLEMGNKLT